MLLDLALPRTDQGALVQAMVAVPAFGLALWATRRNRELFLFVTGLASLTFAWFALRTVH